jgi:hypothetical protein
MAKNELAKKDIASTALTSTNAPLPTLSGFEESDFKIPVAWLCQGSGEEMEDYPNAVRGAVCSKLFGTPLPSTRFAVIEGWMSWAKFVKGNKQPEYNVTDKADVPAVDLEWSEEADGKRIPPIATQTMNFILLFEGLEEVPHVFRFKKTSFKAGQQLATMVRFLRGRMFEFGDNVVETNSEGQKYLVPTVRASDQPITDAMVAVMSAYNESKQQGRVTVDDDVPI